LSLLAEIDSHQALSQRLELHQQAIELAPSEPYNWLSYARTARAIQGEERALFVLKAAEQTLPNNPFIQYALGEYYLS
ncbi:MAG: hypothetical protein N3D16_04060, partial [Anaerolineales bacterium]|nr:hypothetical protein [Anaerolineales bacterium]